MNYEYVFVILRDKEKPLGTDLEYDTSRNLSDKRFLTRNNKQTG